MAGVATGFAVIGVVILVGYLLGRSGVLGENGHLIINRVAFFAATPALLFTVTSRSDLHDLTSPVLIIAVIAFLVAAGSYLLLSRFFVRGGFGETVVGMGASGFANNNNIGLPLTLYVLGDIHYAAIVLLMQTILVTPSLLTALSAAAGGKPTVGSVVKGLVTNPIIIASAAGLTVAGTGIQLPEPVVAPFDLIAGAAIPIVLIAFGASFVGLRPLQRGTGLRGVVLASFIKVALMPFVAYLAGTLIFHLDGRALFASVLIAALPTGQMVFSYAARYGVGIVVARDTVLATTVACVPVIVGITALLGG